MEGKARTCTKNVYWVEANKLDTSTCSACVVVAFSAVRSPELRATYTRYTTSDVGAPP